jgi:hypothetical protein
MRINVSQSLNGKGAPEMEEVQRAVRRPPAPPRSDPADSGGS